MEQPDLGDIYAEVCTEGPVPLESFLRRVQSGEWGLYDPAAVDRFLQEMESATLENMSLMLSIHPELGEDFEARQSEQRAEFERLRRRYVRGEDEPRPASPEQDSGRDGESSVPAAFARSAPEPSHRKDRRAQRIVRVLGMLLGVEPFSMQDYVSTLREELGYRDQKIKTAANEQVAQDLADALRRLGFRLAAVPAEVTADEP